MPRHPHVGSGALLKSYRTAAQLSQCELCEKVDGRIRLGTLRSWEQGRAYPDALALSVLRTVLDFNPDVYLQALRAEIPTS